MAANPPAEASSDADRTPAVTVDQAVEATARLIDTLSECVEVAARCAEHLRHIAARLEEARA